MAASEAMELISGALHSISPPVKCAHGITAQMLPASRSTRRLEVLRRSICQEQLPVPEAAAAGGAAAHLPTPVAHWPLDEILPGVSPTGRPV